MKKSTPNSKKNIIFSSTVYLFIITLVLFAFVFFVTKFTQKEDDDILNSETSSEEINIITPAPILTEEPIPHPDADNAWAMFIVNSKNPLPENYDSSIKTKKVHENYREHFLDERAADYLINMIAAAKDDGITLDVLSSYRTISYQQTNFDNSVQARIDNEGMSYEEAYADTLKEVALPGCSEHNAGLAVDIMSDEYSSFEDDGFKNTKAYAWLQENAADYGFIMSFPEDKFDITGIIYEPWHYRFVGIYYANELKRLDMCLEEYYEYMGWSDENGVAIKMTSSGDKSTEENAKTSLEYEPQTDSETYTKAETKPEQSVVIVV